MQEFAKWDSFYVIVGSASGALIGLQFVVLTLIAQRPQAGVPEAGAAFATPTIIHFSSVLFLSALLRVPWQAVTYAADWWGVMGFIGVAYAVITGHRMRRQSAYRPEFEDWLCHLFLPVVAYAMLAFSSFLAASHTRVALFWVGAAALLLLFIGIHNAWDGVSYHVFVSMRKAHLEEQRDKEQDKQ